MSDGCPTPASDCSTLVSRISAASPDDAPEKPDGSRQGAVLHLEAQRCSDAVLPNPSVTRQPSLRTCSNEKIPELAINESVGSREDKFTATTETSEGGAPLITGNRVEKDLAQADPEPDAAGQDVDGEERSAAGGQEDQAGEAESSVAEDKPAAGRRQAASRRRSSRTSRRR